MSNKMTKLSLNIRKTKIVEQALNFWNDEKIQTAAQTKNVTNPFRDWYLIGNDYLASALVPQSFF